MNKEYINGIVTIDTIAHDKRLLKIIFNEPVNVRHGDELVLEYRVGLRDAITIFGYIIRKESDGKES